MSYMGYYFYPDALESINDNAGVGKIRRPGWVRALVKVALVAGLLSLLLVLIAL
jgi:hypothetical protein